jgi:hypothetical protein
MNLSRLHTTDLFGRFFLKLSDNEPFTNYFHTINAIRPLLNSRNWHDVVTGYYINVADNMDTVRLSYFTTSPQELNNCVNSFCLQNHINIQINESPHLTRTSGGYGNEELRFRRFLYIYTLIGLDIMQANLLNARCLMATFRLQVMLSRQPYPNHFQRTFEAQSPSYNSLSQKQKSQFWSDLSNWPNPPQVDWAHLMVNMILPGDFRRWEFFCSPHPPISLEEINKIIISWGFQIPNDWHPL